jgi:RNA polymerase sigma-70 factor (ECF subfamily)
VALNARPPEQKQVLELAYFGGLSHSEIAAQLAAPIGTVKSRIRLGLDHLRSAMGVPQDVLSAS